MFASFSFEPRDTTITLQLTALIEGLYRGVFMIPDTVKVYLCQATAPCSKVDSAKILLDSTGYGTGKFYDTPSGNYYIVVTHRNSIETWSREGGEFF